MSASRPKKVSPSWSPYGRQSLPRAGRVGHPRLVVGRQPGSWARMRDSRATSSEPGSRPSSVRAPDGRSGSRRESIGLSPAAVLRQREQCPPALTERLLPVRPCRRSPRRRGHRIQAGLEQVLLGRQPQLPEPDRLEPPRHPVLQLPERRTPPQGERVGQHRDGTLRRPGGDVLPGPLDQVLQSADGRCRAGRAAPGSPPRPSRSRQPPAPCGVDSRSPWMTLAAEAGRIAPHRASARTSAATAHPDAGQEPRRRRGRAARAPLPRHRPRGDRAPAADACPECESGGLRGQSR